jgi:hypothetical protein
VQHGSTGSLRSSRHSSAPRRLGELFVAPRSNSSTKSDDDVSVKSADLSTENLLRLSIIHRESSKSADPVSAPIILLQPTNPDT